MGDPKAEWAVVQKRNVKTNLPRAFGAPVTMSQTGPPFVITWAPRQRRGGGSTYGNPGVPSPSAAKIQENDDQTGISC